MGEGLDDAERVSAIMIERSFETKLKAHLHATHGEEWCTVRDISTRSLESILDDYGIHLPVQFEKPSRWGREIPLVEPTDMRPFSEIKPTRGLTPAITATREWSLWDAPSILLLQGVPGCGKTILAKAACHRLWQQPSPCVLFVTESDVMGLLGGALGKNRLDAVMEELCQIPNLIYDDFGTEVMGDARQSWRDHIFRYRWENHETCRTMITTNLREEQLREQSPRIASRITDKTRAVTVTITAPDYRGQRHGP